MKTYTQDEAIEAAKAVFESQEYQTYLRTSAAYDKARKVCDEAKAASDKARPISDEEWTAYDKARVACGKAGPAYDEAWAAYVRAWAAFDKAVGVYTKAKDACMTVVSGIRILCERRAFNLKASDRDGIYCVVLTRKELWVYDGRTCPDPETVEVVWKED